MIATESILDQESIEENTADLSAAGKKDIAEPWSRRVASPSHWSEACIDSSIFWNDLMTSVEVTSPQSLPARSMTGRQFTRFEIIVRTASESNISALTQVGLTVIS